MKEDTKVSCGRHSAPPFKECPDIHGSAWCNGDFAWIEPNKECVLIPGNTSVTDIDHHEDEKYIVKAYSCLDEETKHLSTISLTQIRHCHLKDFTNYEKKTNDENFDILKILRIEEFRAQRCHIWI